jgi:carbamoyl-phosphate synthase small subunit
MSGYQEVLTDPSYHEQILVMTAAHIGNYGVNPEDAESGTLWPAGFIARSFTRVTSSHRAKGTLENYLKEAGIPGLYNLDTRALTRHIRDHGAQRAAISTEEFNTLEQGLGVLKERLEGWPGMVGRALAGEVSTKKRYTFATGSRARVHVLDGGVKRTMLQCWAALGCHVEVFPATARAEELKEGADLVFLSNGPGDPAALPGMIGEVKALMGKIPLLGVCLGHQILGLAIGADTFKLRFGHRGINHPVRDHQTGKIEITSQNHGFCVDPAKITHLGGHITHTNLYDGTLEGFAHEDLRVMCVQFHPEAAPGPHDSSHLFARYLSFAGVH